MYRLFIAIDLPEDVREQCANICYGVPGARWVQKDQMHLTIRFIGDVDESGYHAVNDALADVIASRFTISLKGVGYFPPHNKPKVLWAGLEKSDALLDLRRNMETILSDAGIEPEERKFAAHITLARLSPNTPIRAVADFLSANGLFAALSIPVGEFHLYSSVLTNQGAIHRKEASYPLLN